MLTVEKNPQLASFLIYVSNESNSQSVFYLVA